MSYDARVFTILIASPGDVAMERSVISEVIHEWNNINSRDRSIVLLPLRWETHSHPEMGAEPQEIINRQIVDGCDIAVGVFWTRLGTPTSSAESGTAEEVARVGQSGKTVMLYFSKAPVSPDSLDLQEIARLRKFKSQQFPKGLIEEYTSVQEFRDKFARQLASKILEIAAGDAKRQSKEAESSGDTPEGVDLLRLTVVGDALGIDLQSPVGIPKIVCTDAEKIPDYKEIRPTASSLGTSKLTSVIGDSTFTTIGGGPDRNYYRRLVKYAQERANELVFRFGIETEHQAVRDVYVQMRISSTGESITLSDSSMTNRPSRESGYGSTILFSNDSQKHKPKISQIGTSEWAIEFEMPVVQVGRKVLSEIFYLKATNSTSLHFEGTIYSSNSKPFLLEQDLEMEMIEKELPYRDILKMAGEEI